MVCDLLGIYQDGGTLTQTQRKFVDEQLFAGSDVYLVYHNYDLLCCLDMLSALGKQPGLDHGWIQRLVKMAKIQVFDEKEEQVVFDTLDEFAHLIRPLSQELVNDWPPTDRVLSLY